jgi:hypothetical protein
MRIAAENVTAHLPTLQEKLKHWPRVMQCASTTKKQQFICSRDKASLEIRVVHDPHLMPTDM